MRRRDTFLAALHRRRFEAVRRAHPYPVHSRLTCTQPMYSLSESEVNLAVALKHSGLTFSESMSWQQQYRHSAVFLEIAGVCCQQPTNLMLLRSFLCLAGTCRLRELSNSSRDASRAAVFGGLAETGVALPVLQTSHGGF